MRKFNLVKFMAKKKVKERYYLIEDLKLTYDGLPLRVYIMINK